MTNNIAKIRGKKGLSQTDLAKAVGVSKQALCLAEKSYCPSVKLAQKIADVLNVSIFEVYGESIFRVVPETDEDKAFVRSLL